MNNFDREQFKERVRQAVDLVALIEGDGVPLKKVGGSEWKACCPFHTEGTPSFTVNPEKGFFHCFGCEAHGDAFEWVMRKRGMEFPAALAWLADAARVTPPSGDVEPRLYRAPVPALPAKPAPLEKSKFRELVEGSEVWRYLTEARRIPAATLRAYGVKETHSQPAFYGRAPEDWAAIGFVYRQPDGKGGATPEVVKCLNVAREIRMDREGNEKKAKVEWRHPKDRKSILYGMETVPADAKSVVICEGETDALSWHAYGFAAVSVPGGAGSLGWIELCWAWLEKFERLNLSFDSDRAGQSKLLEIAERLGDQRVRLVALPKDSAGRQFKDANECLQGGLLPEDMVLAVEMAKEIRPDRLRAVYDFAEQIWEKFHPASQEQLGYVLPWGNSHGSSIPFRYRMGEVTVWSGHNGHGKSQVLNHTVVDLGWQGLRSLICSFEVSAPETYRRLIRIASASAKPAGTREAPLSRTEFIEQCLKPLHEKVWVYDHVGFGELEEVLQVALYARRRYDVRVVVIDSLMCLKVASEESQYTEQKEFMNRLCAFAARHGVHVILVAHSKKLDVKGNKEHHIPRKYDIAGSADISNLAWNVVIVWRNKKKENRLAELWEECAQRAKKPSHALTADDFARHYTDDEKAEVNELLKEKDAIFLVDKQRGGEGDEPIRNLWFDRASLQYIERPLYVDKTKGEEPGVPKPYARLKLGEATEFAVGEEEAL